MESGNLAIAVPGDPERARVLVLGRSRRPRLLRRFKRGTTERILQAKRPFDVVVAAEGVDR